jgi:hypothetical protein
MRAKIRSLALVAAMLISGITPAFAIDSPNAPTGVAIDNATPTNSTSLLGAVSVTWTKGAVDASHPAPIAYIISATATGQDNISVTVPVTSPTTTSFTSVVENLTGGVQYQFVVSAKSSNEQTTAAAAIPYVPKSIPRDPTAISAVASPGSATFTWSAPSNKGGLELTKYVITDSATITVNVTDVSLTTYVKTGLTAGQIYKFSITAYNSIGKSSTVNFSDVTIPSAPGIPTGVTAIPGTSNVSVSWSAPLSTGGSTITGYKVSLFNDAGTIVGIEQSTTDKNYDFTGITAGTYTAKVKATNIVGDSLPSGPSNTATIAPASTKLANVPVFNPSTLPNLVIGGTRSFTVSIPSGETATVTATGNPSGACTYSAGVVTAVAEGTCTVRATSPATSTYEAASGTRTFTVTKTLQTITFAAITNKTMPGPLTVSASSTSGLSVTFTASGSCSITSNLVTFVNPGSCTITAAQSGNSSYAAATSVPRTFSIIAGSTNDNGGGSNGNSGGGFSGGGFGGGAGPGPAPSVSPSPSPSASALPTVTATPTPSASPKPSASAVPTATPSVSPTASARPGVTTNAKGEVTKTTTFAVPTKIVGAVKSITLTGSMASISTSLKTTVQQAIPSVKKGTAVKVVIKGSDGKSYTVAATTTKTTGTYKTPAIKFSKPGTYQVTILVGKVKKIVTYKISK